MLRLGDIRYCLYIPADKSVDCQYNLERMSKLPDHCSLDNDYLVHKVMGYRDSF